MITPVDRIVRHDWNDGWNSATYLIVLFDRENPPTIEEALSQTAAGWSQRPETFYFEDRPCVAFEKRFPYGTRF